MDYNELIQMVTDGLPAEEAAKVRAAIERDTVKSRVATLKQEKEYNDLVARQQQLQKELEGGPEGPGAKAYKDWYDKNYTNAVQNAELLQKYIAKYGSDPNAAPQPGGSTLTKEDIQRAIDERIQQGYAPRWSELMKGQMNVIQRHMLAGRKNPIDVDAVQKLAAEKYSGNLEQAYDEWDAPEREKSNKAAEDARVEQRVKDELQKRGASTHFPAGADLTPGALSTRSKTDVEKFDRANLTRDLAQTWLNGAPEAS